MSFDIEQVIKDMTSAILSTVDEGSRNVETAIKKILDAEKASLKELGVARVRGEINEQAFNRELEREKKVVEAELLTIVIMTKALAQKAINAAIDIFVKAVKAAI